MNTSDEEPIPLKEIFGIAGYHTWMFPIDPVFEDYDQVMGFSMPQRLAREQQLMEHAVTRRRYNRHHVDGRRTTSRQVCE